MGIAACWRADPVNDRPSHSSRPGLWPKERSHPSPLERSDFTDVVRVELQEIHVFFSTFSTPVYCAGMPPEPNVLLDHRQRNTNLHLPYDAG